MDLLDLNISLLLRNNKFKSWLKNHFKKDEIEKIKNYILGINNDNPKLIEHFYKVLNKAFTKPDNVILLRLGIKLKWLLTNMRILIMFFKLLSSFFNGAHKYFCIIGSI